MNVAAHVLSRILFTGALAIWGAVLIQAEQAGPQLQRAVEESLRGEDDLERIEVSVAGGEVTLSGRVPHLFAKNQAIERALEVDGVQTVASELEMPVEEQDADLAQRVVEAVNDYPFYTIWDYIDGSINNGVVTLFGSVSPDRDKKGELYEEIAKIRGVQDYIDEIEVQSPSLTDRRLRSAIASQLARSAHFERTVTMRTPPYHIIVDRSIVTLVGWVQGEIEYREMERIVRQTQGVLRVNNQLQLVR